MRRDSYDEVDYLMALRHEFRTPLNAVLGFSDVLLGGIDGDINESQREDLEIVRASGIKLRVLLDSALDLSRLATEDLKPDIESVDARTVVERAANEALQLWAGKQQARVSVSAEPCLVATDEARLRRSIVVLADFLATDNREASIEFDLDHSEGRVVVSIAAVPSGRIILEALPTPAGVLAAEDPMKIRRWPVAVTSELIARNGGSLYHGDEPARFVIRLPTGGE
jgi:K+-sensing histidine kinase KdpD